jgi:hypothetical protein
MSTFSVNAYKVDIENLNNERKKLLVKIEENLKNKK